MTDDHLDTLRAIQVRAGISRQHLRVLSLLCHRPMTLGEVTSFMGISYSQTSRLVADLKKRRMVEYDLWSPAPRPLRPTLVGHAFEARVRAAVADVEPVS
jgi:DNA-binding IclR family transcriptional regulator